MSNQLEQLLAAGQSVWLDNLRRGMFASGELQRLIDQGLRGMTSNPTIFEKAIGTGNDYDEQLRSLIQEETDADKLFWNLAVQDIQNACDAFRSVYDSSGGNDGFVSLEVSPLLANDTAGTIANAKSLWKRVDRPNLMVKIPGTNAGVAAIEECIYAGLNINVTLIFAIEMYEKTARAYIKGLERRIAEGKPVDTIRSVNSVFVSRIDTAVDKLLQAKIDKGETKLQPLLGKTGTANLKLTYQRFREIFEGGEFSKARNAGAQVQRPLWASTSTKNPAYPDLMYVEPVIGKHTVNTMPPNTLDALLDHGKVVPDTIEEGVDEARSIMKQLQEANISLFDVTYDLQVEGVSSFSDSFAALMGAIVYKQNQLRGGAERIAFSLGDNTPHYEQALDKLAQGDFLKKLWSKDPSPWSSDPQAADIIKHALGWLDIPQHLMEHVPELLTFAQDVKREFDHVVVLGMGGSSLAPDVMADTFGQNEGWPQLHVLDSTAPSQIEELDEKLDLDQTLFIVSSKSGTTTEPNAFFAYYYEKIAKRFGVEKAGDRFIAITDPGTKMVEVARGHKFRRIFENDPNIGGRYSALSFFGMVPAALAGYDVKLLLDRGLGAMHANDKTVDPKAAPGVRFGAAIGGLGVNGRDKLTIVTHPDVAAFGAWAEQLIAESTGKQGKGIIPIEGEELEPRDVYAHDRVFVYVGSNLPDPKPGVEDKLRDLEDAGHPVIRLAMNDEYDLGEQFYTWEIATAAAGSILGINAFDQPNVQESKDNTKALLDYYHEHGSIPEPAVDVVGDHFDVTYLSGSKNVDCKTVTSALSSIFGQLCVDDYVAICAYISRDKKHIELLDELRLKIRKAERVATTVGFGPRFLHSTGQLHKGGPNSAVMLQLTDDEPSDPPVPGMNVGFRTLLAAQALGDLQSLDKRNRRGARIHLKGDTDSALRALIGAVDDALSARA
ncbi:MAG: bifunctional transaldolase/phosoglucose isomerase [Candidatus Eremiobacteraeota bacterium]|nr:bifunctional transaldolase/phosoglucose isomerase [Candidatus Eremiobacteraeota bacterium]